MARPSPHPQQLARPPLPAGASPTTAERPTRAYIEGLLMWAGGSFVAVPYTLAILSQSGTQGANTLTSSGVSGGFWGQFWFDVIRDMKFLREEFHDELRGDLITAFPENFPLKIPPTTHSKTYAAVDQVNTSDPNVKITVPEGFRSPEKKADLERLFQKFAMGLIRAEQRASDSTPLRDQTTNTIGLGMGCRSLALNMRNWPAEPQRKKGESLERFTGRHDAWQKDRAHRNPFVTRSIHPLNVFYDRENSPAQWLIVREPVNPWTVRAEYPDWDDPLHRLMEQPGPGTMPSVRTQFLTESWYAIFIDGSPVLTAADGADEDGVAPNPYGFINYWPSAGGSGDQDPIGRPEYELVGIIRRNRDALLTDASIFNQEEVYRQKSMLGPKTGIAGPDREVAAQIAAQVLSSPLKAFHLPPGYSLVTHDVPSVPEAVLDQRSRVAADIDRGMIYDVASGAGSPTEAAARTRVRLFQISRQFATAVTNITQTVEESLQAAFTIIRDVLQEPVGINVALKGQAADYVTIKPEDIPYNMIIEVDLIGDSEDEQARRVSMGMERLKAKTLDLHTFMVEYAQDADPDGIMVGLMMDALREGGIAPAVLAAFNGQIPALLAQVMSEAGVEFSPQELQDAAAQNGGAGGGVGPGGGGQPGAAAAAQPALVAAGPGGGLGAAGGAPAAGAAAAAPTLEVTPQGVALPGVPAAGIPAESGVSGNPQVTAPGSPEALGQQLAAERRAAVPAAPGRPQLVGPGVRMIPRGA